MFQHLPGHLLLHLWIDRFWLEGWEEAEGKEKGCRGAELEEMGQTNESDALALCQLPLDSPTQGTTCIKPRLPFSAVHETQHGTVHISCKPGAQQLHVGLVGSSTAP